jgi:hypothetical protein
MLYVKYSFYFILFHLIAATPLINLYYTDSLSENELQHNCLRVVAPDKQSNAKLAKQNITSQQLYLWPASIDLIERYQLYLNDSSSITDMFYNCTMHLTIILFR